MNATFAAFCVAFGSSLKKKIVSRKVVSEATILHVTVFAICLLFVSMVRGKNSCENALVDIMGGIIADHFGSSLKKAKQYSHAGFVSRFERRL